MSLCTIIVNFQLTRVKATALKAVVVYFCKGKKRESDFSQYLSEGHGDSACGLFGDPSPDRILFSRGLLPLDFIGHLKDGLGLSVAF